jgi:hypothetical protein
VIDRTHYDAVLNDLRENYDTLKGNLEEMETAIRVLERLYAKPAKSLKVVLAPVKEVTPNVVPADSDEFTLGAAKRNEAPTQKLTRTFEIGLTEAIIRAAFAGIYDQCKLIDCVMEMRPGTTRPSVMSMVSTMLSNGRLHKGDDLIVRNVKDGRVQGLPAVSADAAHSHRSFGQYNTQ